MSSDTYSFFAPDFEQKTFLEIVRRVCQQKNFTIAEHHHGQEIAIRVTPMRVENRYISKIKMFHEKFLDSATGRPLPANIKISKNDGSFELVFPEFAPDDKACLGENQRQEIWDGLSAALTTSSKWAQAYELLTLAAHNENAVRICARCNSLLFFKENAWCQQTRACSTLPLKATGFPQPVAVSPEGPQKYYLIIKEIEAGLWLDLLNRFFLVYPAIKVEPLVAAAFIFAARSASVTVLCGAERQPLEDIKDKLALAGLNIVLEESAESISRPSESNFQAAIPRVIFEPAAPNGNYKIFGLDVGSSGFHSTYASYDKNHRLLHPSRALIIPELQNDNFGFIHQLGQDNESRNSFVHYLKTWVGCLEGEFEPGIMNRQSGNRLILGWSDAWDENVLGGLQAVAEQTNLPLWMVIPAPIAILSYELVEKNQQPARSSFIIDWGASTLRISLVECQGGLPAARVVWQRDFVDLGNSKIDLLLKNWIMERYRSHDERVDDRQLTSFVENFKRIINSNFGNNQQSATSRFTGLPVGAPQIEMKRADFDALIAETLTGFNNALQIALAGAAGVDTVLLVGGGSKWFFTRPLMVETLHPRIIRLIDYQDAVASGLSTFGLIP